MEHVLSNLNPDIFSLNRVPIHIHKLLITVETMVQKLC